MKTRDTLEFLKSDTLAPIRGYARGNFALLFLQFIVPDFLLLSLLFCVLCMGRQPFLLKHFGPLNNSFYTNMSLKFQCQLYWSAGHIWSCLAHQWCNIQCWIFCYQITNSCNSIPSFSCIKWRWRVLRVQRKRLHCNELLQNKWWRFNNISLHL